MHVCPTSAHRGFWYGYRHYKDNTFILKTTWFGRKSMILRFDLTGRFNWQLPIEPAAVGVFEYFFQKYNLFFGK